MLYTGAGTSQAVPSDAGVSVRFYLEDGCGQPIPFLHSSMFSVRAGVNNRLITSNARQEGRVTLVSNDHVVDSASKYMYLLVDVSMSIAPDERARVLNSFIDTYGAASGDTYMKIVVFSGRSELLTLTAACDEGFCEDVAMLHAAIDTMQTELDAWVAYDPDASAAFSAIKTAAADIGVVSQAHAETKRSFAGGRSAVGTVDNLIVFSVSQRPSAVYLLLYPDLLCHAPRIWTTLRSVQLCRRLCMPWRSSSRRLAKSAWSCLITRSGTPTQTRL